MSTIPIILQGEDRTDDAYRSATTGARRVASDIARSQRASGDATSKAAKRAIADVRKTTTATRSFGDAANTAFANAGEAFSAGSGGARRMADDTVKAQGRMAASGQRNASKTESAIDRVNKRADSFNKAAATAIGGTVIGAGLRSFADSAIAAGDEAESSSLKLDALLAKRDPGARQGLDALADKMSTMTGFDDDLFVEASARMESFGVKGGEIEQLMGGITGQSETMGDGMAGVLANAEAVGKALNNINAGALTRQGTTLAPEDVAAINELKKSGDYIAARALLFEKIKQSFAQYAVGAGSSLSEAQKQRGRFATQSGNIQEAIGQAAGKARGAWQGALSPLFAGVAGNRTATGALGVGVEASAQLAPVLTFAATLGQAMPTFNLASGALGRIGAALGIVRTATSLATVAETVNTAATVGNTAATSTNSSMTLAASVRTRAAGLMAAGGLAGAATALGAIAVAAYGVMKLREGMEAVKHGTDADLEREHGTWGKIWARGGRGLSNLEARLNGEASRSGALDRAVEVQNRKNAAKFGNRRARVVEPRGADDTGARESAAARAAERARRARAGIAAPAPGLMPSIVPTVRPYPGAPRLTPVVAPLAPARPTVRQTGGGRSQDGYRVRFEARMPNTRADRAMRAF